MKDMPDVRDLNLKVAENIGLRAEMGWFDTEFNFFATAFVDGQGEECYLVSADPNRIYRFFESKLVEGVVCTPVQELMKKCKVPSGAKADIVRDLKVILARAVRERYSLAFLNEFAGAFQSIDSDAAKPILDEMLGEVDGTFDAALIDRFELLVNEARKARVISEYPYRYYCDWIAETRLDMEDDPVVKDVYRSDMYSLRFQQGEKERTLINAKRDRLCIRADEMMMQGVLPSLIFGKTYWYNIYYPLDRVRADFAAYLASEEMADFEQFEQRIRACRPLISADDYWSVADGLVAHYGECVAPMVGYYATLWRCRSAGR